MVESANPRKTAGLARKVLGNFWFFSRRPCGFFENIGKGRENRQKRETVFAAAKAPFDCFRAVGWTLTSVLRIREGESEWTYGSRFMGAKESRRQVLRRLKW